MTFSSTLVPLAAIWVAAHLSPGPDFVVSVRMGVSQARSTGLAVVAGICIGITLWSIAAFFGISVLFAKAPWTYRALKLAGGAYLAYLGLRLLIGSFATAEGDDRAAPPMGAGAALRLGVLTNLTNPNAPLFIASLFSATLPADPSIALGAVAIGVMVVISFSFYGGVVCALTTRTLARAFGRAQRWLDRLAGLVFLALSARFIFAG